ncbi:MAG: VOC family protein [Vagococcus sp.]|uniref:VOC family protein n=2 Tax=Vagococcus sp. TaxID=1933889 RepID=UPI002FCCA65A
MKLSDNILGGINCMGSFSLDPKTKLASVALRVKDFDKMVGFYRHVVRLDLINEENDMAIMGIGEKRRKLVGLIATPEGKEDSNTRTGLYHMAFVFPTREDFALFMKHLILLNYPIEGKSDHGYSESVYINDPEGNRLEFSWDKPKEEWPLLEGKINGVTKELDIQKFLCRVEGEFESIPEETKVGHVHLSVLDLEESYRFYVDKLGFFMKDDDFAHTHFLTVNDYHHQIALNEWTPASQKSFAKETDLGVDHITFDLPNFESLLELKEHLTESGTEFYFNKGKKIIGISDPNGIQLWFIVLKKH